MNPIIVVYCCISDGEEGWGSEAFSGLGMVSSTNLRQTSNENEFSSGKGM
jgi:hypothetical protein